MRVSDFDFALPEELIAQQPPTERGASRMLRLDRVTGAFEDRLFRELPELLEPGDLLVLNDTRVLPARLYATRAGLRTQAGSPAPAGVVEVLLTAPAEGDGLRWKALVKPAKKAVPGERLLFAAAPGAEPLLWAEVVGAGEFGERTLLFEVASGWEFHAVLERIGHLPLPPYIRRERGAEDSAEDRERYQTVYSRRLGSVGPAKTRPQESGPGAPEAGETQGSAAAPTAGLHFTPAVLQQLRQCGVEIAPLTLHVGLGTFQPVRVEDTRDIRLHAEPYTLPAATAEALNRAWKEGRRIVAVGTTTTRTLEHVARQFEAEHGALSATNPLRLEEHSGSTGLFLSPEPDGDAAFKLVRGLVTNFHLPQSTLLMLVSAFAGRERVLGAYRHAVEAGYRFFSYGDCMLLL